MWRLFGNDQFILNVLMTKRSWFKTHLFLLLPISSVKERTRPTALELVTVWRFIGYLTLHYDVRDILLGPYSTSSYPSNSNQIEKQN